MALVLKHSLSVYVNSQSADSGPPLGTVLGNLGVNAIKFCKDFNEFTSDLPSYFQLSVFISIFEDRSCNFKIFQPSTGYLISLLRFDRIVKHLGRNITEHCILLKDVIQLALFKFPNLPLQLSLKIILGSVKSAGLIIVKFK